MTLGTQSATGPNETPYYDIAAALNNMNRSCFSSNKKDIVLKVDKEASSVLNVQETTPSCVDSPKNIYTQEELDAMDERMESMIIKFLSSQVKDDIKALHGS
ncbi:MAG: hypothetical protein H0X29_03125 [Parachlamydiaceae bacterium]|nr:hypothetical protein [Parachlamydiaceae bacterium]